MEFDLDEARAAFQALKAQLEVATAANIKDLNADSSGSVAGKGSDSGTGDCPYLLIIKGEDVE
jgi:hypothetical protein